METEKNNLGVVPLLLAVVCVTLIGLWAWDHHSQAEALEETMALWCPYWEYNPPLCQSDNPEHFSRMTWCDRWGRNIPECQHSAIEKGR